MNQIQLLILQGPPGVGKSTIAKAIAVQLRNAQLPHAIIELDDLARIYPREHLHIMYDNLAVMWPNYEKLGNIKIILPTYLQKGELEIVRQAAPAEHLTLCEIIAPQDEIHDRIKMRDADPIAQERLLRFVDGYSENRADDNQVSFKVINHNRKPERVAREIRENLEWLC